MNTRQQAIAHSRSYHLSKQLSLYLDDYYLDGVIGLIPIVGQFVSQLFNVVFIYVALIKLRSIRLTLVVIFNGLVDIAIGLIPLLGPVLDFWNKSYKRNFELIEGFIAGNSQVVQQVNRQASIAAIGLVLTGVAIFYLTVWSIELLQYLYAVLMA